MLFLTRWFGVTGSDAERDLAREQSDIEQIVEKSLLMQANAAAKQQRPLDRGTHAKGVSVHAQFEVFDVSVGRDHELAARLAKGMFAKPGAYPAIVRFANADPNKNSDFKADVRALSFSVDLTRDGTAVFGANLGRQDFAMQNTKTLPINDAAAFVALSRVLTASSPAAGLRSLPFKDKLRVLRTLTLVQFQLHQRIKPYQQLRYESDVPFRHGPVDVVKQSLTPSPDNPANPVQRSNPNGLHDELIRHVQEDNEMSSFDFGVQLLDVERMTYWGKRQNANFWIENASIKWKQEEAPFHTVARLTLLSKSQLQPDAAEATYIDVTGNSTPDSTPLGSINRARQPAEVACRKARMRGQELRAIVPGPEFERKSA
jgi:catalase